MCFFQLGGVDVTHTHTHTWVLTPFFGACDHGCVPPEAVPLSLPGYSKDLLAGFREASEPSDLLERPMTCLGVTTGEIIIIK